MPALEISTRSPVDLSGLEHRLGNIQLLQLARKIEFWNRQATAEYSYRGEGRFTYCTEQTEDADKKEVIFG